MNYKFKYINTSFIQRQKEEIRQFFDDEEAKRLLASEKISDLYKYIYDNNPTSLTRSDLAGIVTEILYLSDIDITEYTNEIPKCAFAGTLLKEINIPNNITLIDFSAFRDCDYIEEIVIPGNVKTIRGCAFKSCFLLKKVILEEGVEILYSKCFDGIPSRSEIFLPDSISYIEYNAISKTSIVKCHKGSYAQKRCKELDLSYDII